MQKINKGYIFRLYPDDKQIELIEKTFASSRYIYNYFLSKNTNNIDSYQCIKQIPKLTKEKTYLNEVDGCSLRTSIFSLEADFKKFNRGHANKPKFKSKFKSRQSYQTTNFTCTYSCIPHDSISIDLNKKVITLPKLKEVSIRGYRKLKAIEGKIINATIYKEASKYYVSISVEELINIPKVIPNTIVGIDLGIKNLLTTSDGITVENKKYIEKYENKLKGLNKWLSRSNPGSKNRYKIVRKIQTVYKKLKNARKNFLHSISNRLVNDNDIIVTEKLKVQAMIQNGKLSKKIYDASWCRLIKQLEYKCKWKGKYFYQVDTYYPSSQICSRCGHQERKVKDLNIRKWNCPKCNSVNDRDINASLNIMYEGLKMYLSSHLKLKVNKV